MLHCSGSPGRDLSCAQSSDRRPFRSRHAAIRERPRPAPAVRAARPPRADRPVQVPEARPARAAPLAAVTPVLGASPAVRPEVGTQRGAAMVARRAEARAVAPPPLVVAAFLLEAPGPWEGAA